MQLDYVRYLYFFDLFLRRDVCNQVHTVKCQTSTRKLIALSYSTIYQVKQNLFCSLQVWTLFTCLLLYIFHISAVYTERVFFKKFLLNIILYRYKGRWTKLITYGEWRSSCLDLWFNVTNNLGYGMVLKGRKLLLLTKRLPAVKHVYNFSFYFPDGLYKLPGRRAHRKP